MTLSGMFQLSDEDSGEAKKEAGGRRETIQNG